MSFASSPIYLVSQVRQWARFVFPLFLAISCVLAFCQTIKGQSTFGTVLGSVKDPSGSAVPKAKISLVNTGTNATRSTEANASGAYQFNNIDVGTYQLTAEAPGFQKTEYQAFELGSRDIKHVDIDLNIASQAATVTVEAIATVQTDASNVSESKGALELTDLPVAIYTRSQGSTSAFSTLTAQPGVQTDANNNIQVAGASPSQVSVTIDGISSVGVGFGGSGTTGSALTELFPSFNAIEEIKISETLNPAEYGGVADITTVSKSGTNTFHGGLFENVQNTAFNAADTFSNLVSPVKLNNFGAYIGGPVIFPKLYNGRNKTFFFASGEILRLPKSQTTVLSVPTQAMRNGDLSAYLDPANGGADNLLTGYPGNIIPKSELNPFGQKLLNFFYPLPNYGPPGAIANNYLATFALPINSAQGDVRVDQVISPKHLVYVRYTYKNRRVTGLPQDGSGSPGSPLVGNTSRPEIYNAFTAAYNWVISPSIVNELRGGFSAVRFGASTGVTSQQAATYFGLTSPPLPGAVPPGDDTPTISLTGFLGSRPQTADTNPSESTSQVLDSITWTKQKHTMKFGGDFRHSGSLFTQVFKDYQLGSYAYNGSTLGGYLGTGAATPLASLLLGYPDQTTIGSVLNPATDAQQNSYAFFAQDDWKVSQSLTINFGLRWEYHPGFHDINNNITNWVPDYVSTVDGQTVHGASILPNQAAFANVNPQFAASIYPTPIILASKLGLGESLRENSKKDFAPRVGFAYRLGGSNKTVIRGGYGRFIEALQSATAINGWSVESSNIGYFFNSIGDNGKPVFQTPYSYPANTAQPGTQFYDLATNIHYKDPIVEEWNLTLERDLGKSVGMRVSYDGNHSYNIPTLANINQIHPNTKGYNTLCPDGNCPQGVVPFPQVSFIETGENQGFGNYQAGTVSVHKRSSGLQFQASYTYSRNLSNNQGVAGTTAPSYADEFGRLVSDFYNPGIDYGNVPFSRRNRFLATFLYELPFGKRKAFLNSAGPVLDQIVGGFVLSGVALFQSGPFMTVTIPGSSDPSGTGFPFLSASLVGNGGRADTVAGIDPYKGQSLDQWINPAAFTTPADNIGRFGNSQQGAVQGPATKAVSISLLKRIPLAESVRLEFGAQVSNITNHPNYNPPGNLTLGVPGFGQITNMQTAEGAGPRAIQLTGRLTF
jgi:hypothetical protein